MGIFGNKSKDGAFSINFSAVEGTPLWDELYAISAILREKDIEFKHRIGKKESIFLAYDQIRRIGIVTEEEISQVDKSVVGRAMVGKLLFGNVGAIVGAIDGTGKKTKTNTREFFVINYISSSGEEAALPLEIVGATLGLNKFREQLKSRCSNLEVEETKQISNRL